MDFFEALRNAVGGDSASTDPTQVQRDGLTPVAAALPAREQFAPVAVSAMPDNLAPVSIAGGGNGSLDPV
jgi:hypothetical protein